MPSFLRKATRSGINLELPRAEPLFNLRVRSPRKGIAPHGFHLLSDVFLCVVTQPGMIVLNQKVCVSKKSRIYLRIELTQLRQGCECLSGENHEFNLFFREKCRRFHA